MVAGVVAGFLYRRESYGMHGNHGIILSVTPCVPWLMPSWPTRRKTGRKSGCFRGMLAIFRDGARFLKICFSPNCVFAATKRFWTGNNALGSVCSTIIRACYRDVRRRYPPG